MNMDNDRKRPTARKWLVVRIVGALLGMLLVTTDVVWKLAAGWFASDQGNPPIWLYLPPRAAAVIVLMWFIWWTWSTRSS